MDRPTRTIDPEGEVIIVLSNPNAPFAQLSEDMITDVEEESSETLSENEKRKKEDKETVPVIGPMISFLLNLPNSQLKSLLLKNPLPNGQRPDGLLPKKLHFKSQLLKNTRLKNRLPKSLRELESLSG
ncbi:hypothetical protein V6Z93_005117 [Aspergillus fumigatus]